jgi:uncharacterized protein with PQ loop repeat
MFSRIKTFDFYPKTMDDFRVKTLSGATISIVALLIIALLFFSEFIYFLQVERHDELYVDTSAKTKIEIYLNMTFPAISCDIVTIDVVDVAGEIQHGIESTIYKRRLDIATGRPLDEYKFDKKLSLEKIDEQRVKIHNKVTAKDYCGSCYGSETEPKQCCNTCLLVKESYKKKGWEFIENDDVEQCYEESQDRKRKYATLEGCNLNGFFLVNKVAGNFHFSPGKTTETGTGAMHDYLPFEIEHFNTSHIIHSLGFGQKYPGLHNPLDDVTKVVTDGSALYQYFIKVVPTIYEEGGIQMLTNQYSVTQHMRPHNRQHQAVVPGVFFMYDMSPIMVHITERKKSLLHFITNLCAVLGGVFTVAGIIDSMVYRVLDARSKVVQ